MRVALDTRSLRPPLTGIGHYVHRLTNAILPLLSSNEKLLSFNGLGFKPLDHNFLVRIAHMNSNDASEDSMRSSRLPRRKSYLLLRQIYPVRRAVRALYAARFHIAQKQFDLFHAVNYLPPGGLHKPILPIIYDLSYVRFPEMHPVERIEWLGKGFKLLADVPFVQTISEFSKSEIVALLGISSDRVHVTYPAPGEYFRREAEVDDLYLAKFNVESRRYFLVVGTREPRKNFKTVAEAYIALPEALQAQFPLLWAGASGWGDLSLSPAIERAKDLGRIRLIGYVSDRDLAALYRNATLFVMPSVYEGFGMPVVEAMACGARTALSRIPVFEEIAGGYARYVDPMDVDGWRVVMQDTAEDPSGSPVHHGVQARLARFSWRSSAATTLDLYRRLARS